MKPKKNDTKMSKSQPLTSGRTHTNTNLNAGYVKKAPPPDGSGKVIKCRWIIQRKEQGIIDGQLEPIWYRVGAAVPEINDGRWTEKWGNKADAEHVLAEYLDDQEDQEFRLVKITHSLCS